MKENQYNLICKSCDKLLLGNNISIERVSIPWLHVIREHYHFTKKYKFLLEKKNTINFFKNTYNYFIITFYIIANFIRSANFLRLLYSKRKITKKNIDIIFISHFVSLDQINSLDDFYFGEVSKNADKYKSSAIIALTNFTSYSSNFLNKKINFNRLNKIVLSKNLNLFREIYIFIRLLKESRKLRILAKYEKDVLLKKIYYQSSKEALSQPSFNSMRVGLQISDMVSKYKPKKIVTTYEGHAWERVVFALAKKYHPQVHCIGYVHSSLFRLQHSITRNLNQSFNPDKIFTTGVIPKKMLEKKINLIKTPISIFGSNTNVKNVAEEISNSFYQKKITCLVLPEGIDSECDFLFNFSLKCSKILSEVIFIWRLHPMISFENLFQKKVIKSFPPNIILSKDILRNDINKSHIALYRGSSSISQVIRSGVRPIYIEQNNEMTIDPFYELNEWRIKINSVPEFVSLINNNILENSPHLNKIKKEAINYCNNYFMPINYATLFEDISKKN